ncbi:hypothetical protein [Chroococcus sp. FPU101]|uniref:hypothetical protein n=1 Tax=Chroococcus sp. FPU101 TaxID=1974212 RepID=UPI001A8E5E22|nr:hypothetical protein [Chroococcus sp. FPU101]GFE71077.1 hypothetical protein CFPU101_36870 [Chroococcus sp. FPU101]
MAQLPEEITEIFNQLKQQALNVIHSETKVELSLVDSFEETEQILPYLNEMKNISEEAIRTYSQLSTLQLQIAQAQPLASPAMLELLNRAINKSQARIPTWIRSIEEVNQEWNIL